MSFEEEIKNTSGTGEAAVVPEEIIKKFNWGAFLLTWIWGLGNKTYLPLIIIPVSFVPFLGSIINFGLSIWFGMKGNEWAWRNKRFISEEDFHSYQKLWTTIGIIWLLLMSVVGIIVAILAYNNAPAFFELLGRVSSGR